MKKFTTIILMLLVCACFMFGGCTSNVGMPENYDMVVSNGGFVVGAGNYMYFGNAYKSYSELTDGDNNGNVNQYSLNRLELDRQTHPNSEWFKLQKNEEESYDFKKVADKISAYQTSNLYVVNEYLYFTSPNVHKNKLNEHEYNLSSMFRIRLDGTGLKELFTTESSDAKFYLTGGENKQLIVFDSKTIYSMNVSKNETRLKKLTNDIDVEGLVFPTCEQELTNIYFTTGKTTGFSGNQLYKLNLVTGEASQIKNIISSNETLTILAYEYGTLFYSKSLRNKIYSNDFSGDYPTQNEKEHLAYDSNNTITNLTYVKCEDEENNCFAFIYNNKLYVQMMSSNNISQAVKLSDKDAKIQMVNNGSIYYSSSDGIYKISVKEKVEKQISNLENFNAQAVDFDGRYIYFYAKEPNITSNTEYLYRADTYVDYVSVECIALLLEEDVATDETAE